MGTVSSHTDEEVIDITHLNFIVLCVMENELYRKYFVLPRKSQIYERIQSEKLTVPYGSTAVKHTLDKATDGSLIAFFNNDVHNINLVCTAQDGGELTPYQAVSFFENAIKQQYSAIDVTHLQVDRDAEIVSSIYTTENIVNCSVRDRVNDWKDISSSILKLKL